MMTLLDAVCCAGDRQGQNEDRWGIVAGRAFVIDGATDIEPGPVLGQRSAAAWLSQTLATALSSANAEASVSQIVAQAARAARAGWDKARPAGEAQAWRQPVATLMAMSRVSDGIEIAEFGDCRAFIALKGGTQRIGGHSRTTERTAARTLTPLEPKDSVSTKDHLRREREETVAAARVFGLDERCSEKLRFHRFALQGPAHALICTDGFAALVDTYNAYEPDGILIAALRDGLASLVERTRQIETSDPLGRAFPRFKVSDDATAVLVRID